VVQALFGRRQLSGKHFAAEHNPVRSRSLVSAFACFELMAKPTVGKCQTS
jgi:hypothetical protein